MNAAVCLCRMAECYDEARRHLAERRITACRKAIRWAWSYRRWARYWAMEEAKGHA